MGTYLYQSTLRATFVYMYLIMYCTTQCTYIHYPLFDPKQISPFCIYTWAM